jgi:hypothetical protein
VLVYRNAFPYFYVFALSPAILVSGVLADRLAGLVQTKGSRWALAGVSAVAGIVYANFVVHYWMNAVDATVAERQIVDAVHEMFPDPVPYIDGPAMIATFPKVGFFMSKWGIEAYRAEGRPVLAQAIADRAPVFVLTTNNTLIDAMTGTHLADPGYSLLEADRAALSRNYVRHWGIVYVAGKTLELGTQAPVPFDILIPGPYTVEAGDHVTIDGERYDPGQSVELERGAHVMSVDTAPATITLRWGRRLFRPPESLASRAIFAPFR